MTDSSICETSACGRILYWKDMYMDMFQVSPKTKNVLWILVIDSLLLLLIWLTDSSLDDIKKYKI